MGSWGGQGFFFQFFALISPLGGIGSPPEPPFVAG